MEKQTSPMYYGDRFAGAENKIAVNDNPFAIMYMHLFKMRNVKFSYIIIYI